MSGFVQTIYLKHLLENEHQRSQNRELLLECGDHLDDFISSVLQVVLGVPVVNHVSHVYLEVLLVDLLVLLVDFDALLGGQFAERARHVDNWPPCIDVVQISEPFGLVIVLFGLQLVLDILKSL